LSRQDFSLLSAQFGTWSSRSPVYTKGAVHEFPRPPGVDDFEQRQPQLPRIGRNGKPEIILSAEIVNDRRVAAGNQFLIGAFMAMKLN
jgi:hypothetical protein